MNVITNNNMKCAIALAALKNVVDPEIGLNIVDLGLIYQLDFDEAEKITYCSMTLTTQFCPMGESITHLSEETLKITFPEYDTKLDLTFNPPWSHERVSEEGRKFLNKR
ncbi:MAG: metal-sulfur cluster assembly factor [Bacteroidota bacterium]|nr:metal-sulfur cluster assembly factor [Bacteroidota bacterium]